MSVSRLIARPLFSSIFVYGAMNALRNAEGHAPVAAGVADRVVPLARRAGVPLPSDPVALVRLNALAQMAGAVAVASGRAPRAGGLLLAGTLVPTTLAGHAFWNETEPGKVAAQKVQFAKNLSLLGGAIIVAGDTDGRPGIAWRARRAARDARREARHQARLAKMRLT